MRQKYKVFIDDYCVFFAPKELSSITELQKKSFIGYDELKKLLGSNDGFVRSNNFPDDVFLLFKNFTLVHAAGGIIEHNDNYLIIFRNGKWDLPKGKVEKNENIEQAALRECVEECGLTGKLEITEKISITYHCYKLDHSSFLKETHWFFMKYEGNIELLPQIEEGIDIAVWVSKNEFIEKCNQSFGSIQDLCDLFIEKLKFFP
jgi:hypothetical protein